ncbi:MAG: hypothetical protein EOP33_01045 [Rickettsiaceae bacterium]|nr:MAG: hypothetical protein EOP33_01045 [Rickettsiaceae bacterium]
MAIKNHPAIVGCNILNEPYPEKIFECNNVSINSLQQEEIQKILYNLYELAIKSIRLVNTNIPIILDSSTYADAKTLGSLVPQQDRNIIYSFHT